MDTALAVYHLPPQHSWHHAAALFQRGLCSMPASHPSALSYLPSSCTLCPTLFTLWFLPGSQVGGVAASPVRPSVRGKRGEEVVLTHCLKKDMPKCTLESVFCFLVQYFLSCCILWITFLFLLLFCLHFPLAEIVSFVVWIRTFCLCCWKIPSTPTFL